MPDEPHDSNDPPDEPSEEELEARLRKLIEGIHPESEPTPGEEELRLNLSDTELSKPSIAAPEELDELELKLRDIDQRIADAGLAGRAGSAHLDPETEARLRDVETRAARAKDAHAATKAEGERKIASDGASTRGLGVGLSIAYTIIGVPLLGIGIGWLLDAQLGTTIWKGLGMLVGAVVGISLAFVLMNRANDLR